MIRPQRKAHALVWWLLLPALLALCGWAASMPSQAPAEPSPLQARRPEAAR